MKQSLSSTLHTWSCWLTATNARLKLD